MDFSSRFLGNYNDEKRLPWYSKKKGLVPDKPRKKHFKDLDEVIYGVKTDSRITKEIIEAEKREEIRAKEEERRDRTREKVFKRYEEYEDKFARIEAKESFLTKDLLKHEEDLLIKEYKSSKEE